MARIDNLGDYNIVRDALYEHDGDAKKLFKDIGDTAVAEKRPELMKEGAIQAAIFIVAAELLLVGANKLYGFIKQSGKDTELIKGKEKLKTELEELSAEIKENEEVNNYEEER